jgi:uncharacterized protein DUF6218
MVIGHVVVTSGLDDGGRDAVAVWHVDTGGVGTGAWIMPVDLDEPDPETARQVLRLCLRRAVVAWRPEEPVAVLTRLAAGAGVVPFPWLDTAIALPEIIGDVASTRLAYEKHTTGRLARNKNTTPLEWPVDLPEHLPSTEHGMWRAIRLALPSASPVAERALMTTMLTRWTSDRWRETTSALGRRSHLQEEFGQPRPLSPAWEARLTDSYRLFVRLTDVTRG